MRARSLLLCLIICWFSILPSGCGLISMIASPNIPITPIPNKPATATPDTPATPAPEAYNPQHCAWVWATRALPELSTAIQQAVDAKGINSMQVHAIAFGENCVDSQTHQVRGFATRETDFDVRMILSDPLDTIIAGNELAGLLDVLTGFPPDNIPGSAAGRINFTLLQGQDETYLILSWQQAIDLQSRGLKAAELWEALLAIQSP